MRILIVGGGIAGLSLAKALELRGIAAELIERQPTQPVGGAGLYLPGNAARAITQLGLINEVTAKAVPIASQRIFEASGRVLNSVETAGLWRDCGLCLSLPRNDMQAILQSAIERTQVQFGKSIAAIRQFPGACEAVFADGSSGSYDLIVGADGVNSAVRRIAFTDTPPDYVGNVCWRFITKNTAGIDGWTAMLGNGRTLLAIPVSATDVYVYADLAVEESRVATCSDRTALAPLFAGFGAPVFQLVEAMPAGTEVHFGRIEQVRMAEWVQGRVVLIGDAAHASSPSMAEGAGMAMEDALVLAETLTAGSLIDDALRAYALRRRPRVDWVHAQCKARDKMRALPGLARNTILKLFGTALYKRSYTPLLAPI